MLKPRLSMAVVLAAGSLAISSCASGDTIVSVNYSFDDATAGDVKMKVAKLHIEISAASGGSVQTDVDIMRDLDAGTITTASYKRVKADGLSGEGKLTVTALDSGGGELMKVMNVDDKVPFNAPFTIESHEVTSAYVKFAKPAMPMGSGGSSGSGGSTEGSGGSTEGSGGSTGSGGSGSGGSTN
jgi:uncharacterized membrane protein YgcG